MAHLPSLIIDLTILLSTAAVVTLLFKKIGQPVVLGYLLAGILIGPEIKILPTVRETDAIQIWAEIGVIFLLFALGLEFSFKKLAAVGRGASITAAVEVLCMLGLGFLIGQSFGWRTMDSLFLGGILSISSTTIIIRAFDELGMKRRRFASLVFGVLIVEDVVAVLLLVLLSTIAISKSFQGAELALSTGRLAFFLTIWFLAGIFFIPWLMRSVRSLLNEETSLILSLALCFLMVALATKSGFSAALGAFIMGSILAETPDGERIEKNLRAVRDLFAAIFFVSVGMLIDLSVLADHWGKVLIISFFTIFGKIVSTCVGALFSGQTLRHSVQSGMSLAQIGEFSFIIATLGLTLDVTSQFLYPIAVAVSVITTFTTPYLIRAADPTYAWLERNIPQVWLERLHRYHLTMNVAGNASSGLSLKALTRPFVNSTIVIGAGLTGSRWLLPWLRDQGFNNDWSRLIALSASTLLALPFLWAIFAGAKSGQSIAVVRQNIGQLTTRALMGLIGRTSLAIVLIGILVSQFVSALASFTFIFAVATALIIFGFRNLEKIYHWLENRFVSHLNEKEVERLKTEKLRPRLAPWDAHLAEITVQPESAVIGESLLDLALREKVGITIALIQRGNQQIMAPSRDTVLMPHDRVFAIGTDEQITALSLVLESPRPQVETTPEKHYGLEPLTLSAGSPFVGRTIRDSGLRESAHGLVVGIERGDQRILNPDSALRLEPDDCLWIVGDRTKISSLKNQPEFAPS